MQRATTSSISDKEVQEEVRNVARAVAAAVRELRAGTLSEPDKKARVPAAQMSTRNVCADHAVNSFDLMTRQATSAGHRPQSRHPSGPLSRNFSEAQLLDEQEIRRLLLATAARDVDAFARLYKRCAPLLLGVAQRITRRKELAEEVVHDGFTRIWRAADSFDPFGAPVGWMTAIVRNRAIDVMETHDMARVDSYHAALDDQPEASLDQMFDWSRGCERRRRARRQSACAHFCVVVWANWRRPSGRRWCSPTNTG